MLQQQAGRLGVVTQGRVRIVGCTLERREVHDVVDVCRQVGEVARGEVACDRRDAQRLDPFPHRRVGEPSNADHLEVAGERRCQRQPDLTGHAGDEDRRAGRRQGAGHGAFTRSA